MLVVLLALGLVDGLVTWQLPDKGEQVGTQTLAASGGAAPSGRGRAPGLELEWGSIHDPPLEVRGSRSSATRVRGGRWRGPLW